MAAPALPSTSAEREVVIDDGITVRFRVEPDDWLPIAELATMYHPFNSQVRTAEDEHAIWASIQERGYIGEPIIVNPWNRKLVAGHGRVQVLLGRGYRGKLPVTYEEYPSETEHRLAMLRANMARGHQEAERLEAELAFLRQTLEDERIEHALGLEANSLATMDEEPAGGDAEAMMAAATEPDPTAEQTRRLDEEGICGVHLPGWNTVHEFSVPSIRRWVKDRSAAEQAWFEQRRAADDGSLARELAAEIVDRLEPNLGHSNLPLWVTTPPRAHPRTGHFATQVAQLVAEDLGIAFVQVFSDWPDAQSQAKTREQGTAELQAELPEGLCLLIDDYARTGKTIAAAASALRRSHAAVLPVLWIYGEAAYGRANR